MGLRRTSFGRARRPATVRSRVARPARRSSRTSACSARRRRRSSSGTVPISPLTSASTLFDCRRAHARARPARTDAPRPRGRGVGSAPSARRPLRGRLCLIERAPDRVRPPASHAAAGPTVRGGGQTMSKTRPSRQPPAAPTTNPRLRHGVVEVARLTKADRVPLVRRVGSRSTSDFCRRFVDAGTFDTVRPSGPAPFVARSDPEDMRARGEPHLHLLQARGGHGPDQQLARAARDAPDATGAIRQVDDQAHDVRRTFLDEPAGLPDRHLGVQITDSAYVAVSMRIMTRIGSPAFDAMGTTAVSCRVALGGLPAPVRPRGVPWPYDAATDRSFTSRRRARSGPTARVRRQRAAGKKCLALRIASGSPAIKGGSPSTC